MDGMTLELSQLSDTKNSWRTMGVQGLDEPPPCPIRAKGAQK